MPGLPALVRWTRCEACQHVFTEDYWTDEASALIAGNSTSRHHVGHDLEAQRYVSARIVEKVNRFNSYGAGGAWLDVGPGTGSLLFTAQEWGYTPIGLDIREEVVAALKARGAHAFPGHIETLESPYSPTTVISFADSLEHLRKPKEALIAARRILAPVGILFLSMPNMDTEVWRDLDRQGTNPYWNEIEHYHNFTRARLYALLEETGFTPVHYDVSQRYRCGMEIIAR